MKVVADTGPLVAAIRRREPAHSLASALAAELGRELVVLDPVAFEVDQFLRARRDPEGARSFLRDLVSGEHTTAFLTPGLLARATEIDQRYADLNLGLVDSSVMAYAERHELPILTFDFQDFRAAPPPGGHWDLVVDEESYGDAVGD